MGYPRGGGCIPRDGSWACETSPGEISARNCVLHNKMHIARTGEYDSQRAGVSIVAQLPTTALNVASGPSDPAILPQRSSSTEGTRGRRQVRRRPYPVPGSALGSPTPACPWYRRLCVIITGLRWLFAMGPPSSLLPGAVGSRSLRMRSRGRRLQSRWPWGRHLFAQSWGG